MITLSTGFSKINQVGVKALTEYEVAAPSDKQFLYQTCLQLVIMSGGFLAACIIIIPIDNISVTSLTRHLYRSVNAKDML